MDSDLGLGASPPRLESQLWRFLVSDVWNSLRFSVPQFPHLCNTYLRVW